MCAELKCEGGGRQVLRGQMVLSDCLSPQALYENCLSLPQSPSQTAKEQDMTRLAVDMVSPHDGDGAGDGAGASGGTLRFFAKAVPWSIGDSMDEFEEVHHKRLSYKSPRRRKKFCFVVDAMKLECVSSQDLHEDQHGDGDGDGDREQGSVPSEGRYTLAMQLSTHLLLASVLR